MSHPNDQLNRRNFGLAAGVAASAFAVAGSVPESVAGSSAQAESKKGRLNQSVCRWCFGKMSLEELCQAAVKLGLVGIDLLGPDDFATLKKHNLVCTMVSSHSLTDGLCDEKYHESALKKINEMIEVASAAGYRNVICFSGNARGIDRKTGLKNCAKALRQVVDVAKAKNVILNMELLN
ncbi:MAG: sugar phosphate isomerase/epimerase family protein, partial [Pirellula sp.]